MTKDKIALAVAVLAGIVVAVQSRINGELGARIGDGVAAAAISFGLGLVVLVVYVASNSARRAQFGAIRTALRGGRLRWWQCAGGLAGAAAVASQGVTVTTIGVALFTVAIVAGQVTSGMLVDQAGLGPNGRSPITGMRVVGAALVLVAVAIASHESINAGTNWLYVIFPLLAGAATAWQMAMNGRVAVVGGPMSSTLVNFMVGTSALVGVGAVVIVVRGWPGGLPTEPWLYVGGVLGIVFIAVSSHVVRIVGVLLLALATIAGQLIGALALDWIVPAGRTVSWSVFGACVLALIGVWIGRREPTSA